MIARWLIVGIVIWAAITAVFRYFGAQFFHTGSIAWSFILLPLAVFVLTFLVFKILNVNVTDRGEAAAIMALPGLLAGIYEINSFQFVFPELEPGIALHFAALMYATYAAMIIAGAAFSRLEKIGKS